MKYSKVAIGGTFDHFHDGHKTLLTKAFEVGKTVIIGITSDDFSRISRMSHIRPIESYDSRKRAVYAFIAQRGYGRRYEIIPLADSFGPTVIDSDFDAIVVSPETEPVAHEINTKRAAMGFSPLFITLVPWVNAQDGVPIHSTRIRNGEIDTDGGVFAIPENWGMRTIGQSLRRKLQKPFGKFYTDINHIRRIRPMRLISVGDRISQSLLQVGVVPHIAIIDYHVARKREFSHFREHGFGADVSVSKAKNPAGTLSYGVFRIIQNAYKSYTSYESNKSHKSHVILIDGEEDLTVLFAVLLAPLGSIILYGQPFVVPLSGTPQGKPQEGIVSIEVSLEYKRKAMKFLGEFE